MASYYSLRVTLGNLHGSEKPSSVLELVQIIIPALLDQAVDSRPLINSKIFLSPLSPE